jgi:SAM-dependent methyltransferase
LYSWLPKKGNLVLDIGSARDKNNKSYLENAGFTYISADYDSPEAMILVDAHALPFCDNSFDCLTNLAVMEHIEFPFIAGREFHRVLKNNGRMLGVVAFLQQHHMSSWYHFTHFGVYSWLTNSGFLAEKIKIDAADKKYHGIFNTASLIGLPKFIKNLILYPIYYLHRLLWKIFAIKNSDNFEKVRHLQTTGAIHFIADK